jgi:hypothetical protein
MSLYALPQSGMPDLGDFPGTVDESCDLAMAGAGASAVEGCGRIPQILSEGRSFRLGRPCQSRYRFWRLCPGPCGGVGEAFDEPVAYLHGDTIRSAPQAVRQEGPSARELNPSFPYSVHCALTQNRLKLSALNETAGEWLRRGSFEQVVGANERQFRQATGERRGGPRR